MRVKLGLGAVQMSATAGRLTERINRHCVCIGYRRCHLANAKRKYLASFVQR